jgi:L-threonylcarbamoyladenylate synthase
MEKEIKSSLIVLKEGGVIIYPTDTIWGVGCDATNEKAVEKVYQLKRRSENKSLIVLMDSWEMLEKHIADIPNKVSCIIKGSSKPTSVIYNDPIGLAKNVIANDNTVVIRIVNDEFCKELIRKFKRPIVSTSANYSGTKTPKSFFDIDTSLLEKADYIVNLHRNKTQTMASQIVKVDKRGKIEFIRK